jgi:beta-glucosidase-like glycosyl hydrolase
MPQFAARRATARPPLATAKHYVGDGGTTGGVDQGNTQLSESDLRAIHLPPFQAAVQRGVGAVMISFSSWNGVKMHSNAFLITTVLKGELGFSGFVISDWNGIDQIDGQAGFTAAEVRTAINAGIDMVMVPDAWQSFLSTLRSEARAATSSTSTGSSSPTEHDRPRPTPARRLAGRPERRRLRSWWSQYRQICVVRMIAQPAVK